MSFLRHIKPFRVRFEPLEWMIRDTIVDKRAIRDTFISKREKEPQEDQKVEVPDCLGTADTIFTRHEIFGRNKREQSLNTPKAP